MDDRDLVTEIQELRRTIEAGFVLLTTQMIHSQHPNKGVIDCQANAVQLMRDTLARIPPAV